MKYIQGFIIFFIVGLFLAIMIGPGDNYYRKKSEKVSLPLEVYLTFGFIGGIVGIGVGASWEEEEKKRKLEESERQRRWMIEEEERQKRLLLLEEQRLQKQTIIEKLGLNQLTNTEYKEGRKWIFETTWTNPQSKNLNCIKTFYNKEINSTITTFNSITIANHNSSEGSKLFIDKCHSFNRLTIVNNLIDGHFTSI